ncbi:ATP-dependent RNA helicase SUV3 homolog, mitochondrial-like [Mytilus galloprovincialis]|uniref:ATP-dependent RNA helicase SUV3 homolog, mitochondrial-like n=1 Tax=Mytilus galloprovincialis TaxID=29158 RepID=UPI003F7C91D8
MFNICTTVCRKQPKVHKLIKQVDVTNLTKHVLGFKSLQGQELYSRHSKSKKNKKSQNTPVKTLESLVEPVPYTSTHTQPHGIGEELGGTLAKEKILGILTQFYVRKEVRKFAEENGIESKFFHKSFQSFRKFCCDEENLPVELHLILSDIAAGAGHVDDLLPYFLQHTKKIFPHLECLEDLKKISDLRNPANWYQEARTIDRKIIYHAGPTNSGKTYHALQRLTAAKSGVYCGPLRLLAAEVYNKCNDKGTPCDLVTGEERRYSSEDGEPSNHVACTVEMTSVNTHYEVAVIDEIQMVRDKGRGWAWTRALLGLCAKEIHLCGEAGGIDLVRELMLHTGDDVEVKYYKRLTDLAYLDKAVESFDNIKPGDCIVCFSKNDIYFVSQQLEKKGIQCAVIYGGLPPGAKLAQAARFNDPNDPCKVMVATDAIGMGLNLAIKRVIFYSLTKPTIMDNGQVEIDVVDTSTALQIGGRAGRFGTQFEHGEVTTFRRKDLQLLTDIITRSVDSIKQAGLHPTADQIELFAYHLPSATLCNLIDIFIVLSELDNDNFFMCNLDDFKILAEMIEHIPLTLRVRYVLCCSPISRNKAFVCSMFQKFARQLHVGEPLTFDWLCGQIGTISEPKTITDLVHLEDIFDVFDLYLWLRFRFPEMFPDFEAVQQTQKELDIIIQEAVQRITILLKTTASSIQTSKEATPDLSDESDSILGGLLNEVGKLFKPNRKNNVDKDQTESAIAPSNVEGKLTQDLLKSNILTPEMLEKLKAEWSEQHLKRNRHVRTSRKPIKKI